MNDENRDEERPRVLRGWHVDKRVNIGHIIATVLLAAAAFSWGSKIESRLSVAEAEIGARKIAAVRAENRMIERIERTDARLIRIEDKLDRLIEQR